MVRNGGGWRYLDYELDDVYESGISGDENFLETEEFLPVEFLVGLVGVDAQC